MEIFDLFICLGQSLELAGRCRSLSLSLEAGTWIFGGLSRTAPHCVWCGVPWWYFKVCLRSNLLKSFRGQFGWPENFFKKSFSPHVQTYGFFISKSIFDEFVKEFNWYLTSKDLDFLLKSALCRLLEQGLSKFALHRNYGLGFIQRNRLIKYRRRLKFLDLKGDWTGVVGDYRYSCPSPFLFSGLNDSSES